MLTCLSMVAKSAGGIPEHIQTVSHDIQRVHGFSQVTSFLGVLFRRLIIALGLHCACPGVIRENEVICIAACFTLLGGQFSMLSGCCVISLDSCDNAQANERIIPLKWRRGNV